jgi:hypothetical protein
MASTQPKANGQQTATKRTNGKHTTRCKRPANYQTASQWPHKNNNNWQTYNQKHTASKRPASERNMNNTLQAHNQMQTASKRPANYHHTPRQTACKRPANSHSTSNTWQAHNQKQTASKRPQNEQHMASTQPGTCWRSTDLATSVRELNQQMASTQAEANGQQTATKLPDKRPFANDYNTSDEW